MINILFEVLMISYVMLGFYCATKLNSSWPLWIRLSILAPSFTAMMTIYEIYAGLYTAYFSDAARALSVLLIYVLIALSLTKGSWTKRVNDESI